MDSSKQLEALKKLEIISSFKLGSHDDNVQVFKKLKSQLTSVTWS